MRLALTAVCLAGLVSVASAQKAAPVEATGSVTGHVYLSDTGGPARLATIGLQPVEVKSEDGPYEERRKDFFVVYQTQLDGAYRIPKVKPGTYYVVVRQPGYLSPFALFSNAQLVHPSPDEQQKIALLLPMVTVLPNNAATLDLHLTRGASISGTIRFDDGNPQTHSHVRVMQRNASGKWKGLDQVDGGECDDLGRYRLTGLLAGEYLLRVDISIDDAFQSALLGQVNSYSSSTHYSLDYYSGDTPRQRDAKPIKLESSQEVNSADITIPLSKLHEVSGAIVTEGAGRALNDGELTLSYADDGENLLTANVEADEPAFHFLFVPEGSYTLKVVEAADATRTQVANPPGTMPPYVIKETVLHKYGTAEMPLTVTGETANVNIAVKPAAASQ